MRLPLKVSAPTRGASRRGRTRNQERGWGHLKPGKLMLGSSSKWHLPHLRSSMMPLANRPPRLLESAALLCWRGHGLRIARRVPDKDVPPLSSLRTVVMERFSA